MMAPTISHKASCRDRTARCSCTAGVLRLHDPTPYSSTFLHARRSCDAVRDCLGVALCQERAVGEVVRYFEPHIMMSPPFAVMNVLSYNRLCLLLRDMVLVLSWG